MQQNATNENFNVNGSNEENLNQQNNQSNFANGQIQQRENVISHQQMNIGIQSFSQQQNLPNSF
jgi:hypothetical protein